MVLGQTAPAAVRPTGTHVAIHVSDLGRLCVSLEKAGVSFLQPLAGASPGTRSLKAWIADPDGHEIELAQTREA
jgi:catechol 2,3-dioxygenase-like lactoylglutathione lyase family enzyme